VFVPIIMSRIVWKNILCLFPGNLEVQKNILYDFQLENSIF